MFVNKAFFPGHHIPIKYEVVNMELQKFSPKFLYLRLPASNLEYPETKTELPLIGRPAHQLVGLSARSSENLFIDRT